MQFWDGGDGTDQEPNESDEEYAARKKSLGEFLIVGTTGIWTALPECIERVQYWLDRGKREGIRAHNAKFDRAFGEVTLPHLDWPGDGCWHDSMLTAQTVNERRSVALKAVSVDLFGEDADDLQKQVKAWISAERARRKKAAKEAEVEFPGEEYPEPTYADVPEELMRPYGMEDVYLQRAISDVYDPVLEQTPELLGVYERERQVLDALYAVEKRGLPADAQGYRRLENEVLNNLAAKEERCRELAAEGLGEDADFNPKSTQDILRALEAREADMSFMEREGGKIVSADREQLEAVDDELAEAILDFRSEFKVLSTYVRPMIGRHYDRQLRFHKEPFISKADGRIHANYRQVGARTGRMSCSDPNMQNQPRDDLRLRYNVRAEPGYKLVCVDLKNIEMVLFAAYAGKGRLLDTVRAGGDLHSLTAKMIGITDRRRAGGAIESARQRGKTFNFSVIYGGGLRTIKRQQRVDQAGARLMRRRYYDAYPEVENLQNLVEHRLIQQGYIKDMWGRRYRCTPGKAKKESYKFVNYLIQGSAAQVFKDALIELHANGIEVVALIHDEAVAHVREEEAEDAQALIDSCLTKHARPGGNLWREERRDRKTDEIIPAGPIVPLSTDGVIVDRWSDAKPLKDEDTGEEYLFTPEWAGGERRPVYYA